MSETHGNESRWKKVCDLAKQFERAIPFCIAAVPNFTDYDKQSVVVNLYLHTSGVAISEKFRELAKKIFCNHDVKFVDLEHKELGYFMPRPSESKRNFKKMANIAQIIKINLHLFTKCSNVTAVYPSYKISDHQETDNPCIAVSVLGKGKIPVGEEAFPKRLGDCPLDVVEGYFWPTCRVEYSLRSGVGIGVRGKPGTGTLGALLTDEHDYYLLSCNHVLFKQDGAHTAEQTFGDEKTDEKNSDEENPGEKNSGEENPGEKNSGEEKPVVTGELESVANDQTAESDSKEEERLEMLIRATTKMLEELKKEGLQTDEIGNLEEDVKTLAKSRFRNCISLAKKRLVELENEIRGIEESHAIVPKGDILIEHPAAEDVVAGAPTAEQTFGDERADEKNSGEKNSGKENRSENNYGEENPGEKNSGEENLGEKNSGEENPGEKNSGEENLGEKNSGEENPGEKNSGEENRSENNSGEENPGEKNSGEENLGEKNSGEENPGEKNSGEENPGEKNSGEENLGEKNSGEENRSEKNSGEKNSGEENSGEKNSGEEDPCEKNSGEENAGEKNSGVEKPAETREFESVDVANDQIADDARKRLMELKSILKRIESQVRVPKEGEILIELSAAEDVIAETIYRYENIESSENELLMAKERYDTENTIDRIKSDKTSAESRLVELRNDLLPRCIATYVDGFLENYCHEKGTNFVDAGIAKLCDDQRDEILAGKYKPYTKPITGEVVGWKEMKEMEAGGKTKFWKNGANTGVTEGAEFHSVEYIFKYKNPPWLTLGTFCEQCAKNMLNTSSISDPEKKRVLCRTCQREITNIETKYEIWAKGCFLVKGKKDFCDDGDSGAVVFDEKTRAWGIVVGKYLVGDSIFGVVCSLDIALQALRKKTKKSLRLWTGVAGK